MSFYNQSQLLALAVGFMDVAFIMLILRWCTLRITGRKIYADDICLGITGLLTVAICINMITAAAYGVWGKSLPFTLQAKVPLPLAIYSPPLQQNLQFYWAQSLLYVFQITFARLSIVLFYRRTLVPEPFGMLHWATISVAGILGVWFVAFFFAYIFECGTEVSLFWTGPALSQAKVCVGTKVDLSNSVTGVILDLIIVLLPMHRIMTLKLSPTKKIQIACAFLVGLISVFGGTVRLAAIISEYLKIINVFTTMDPAMVNSTMAYWQAFEVGFAMIAASLPGLRPLINRVASVVDNTFSSMVQRSTKGKTWRSESDASFNSTNKMVKMTIHKGQVSQVEV